MKTPCLLAALALLGLPLVACDKVTATLSVCTITGQVTVEGMGVEGVLITLSTGESAATDQNGNFRFDNVEGETVTISISGFPSEATFDQTSATAAIPCDGNIITINFTGFYDRTASVLGTHPYRVSRSFFTAPGSSGTSGTCSGPVAGTMRQPDNSGGSAP
jgi:hypothetical protein